MIIVPANLIIAELTKLGFDQVVRPKHGNFLCPARAWIKEFCNGLWGRLGPWRNDHTCVDFTAEVNAFAEEAFRKGEHPADINLGPAFGWCDIVIGTDQLLNNIEGDGDTKHETCLVRDDEGEWHFLEGQSCQFCPAQLMVDAGFIYELLSCRV